MHLTKMRFGGVPPFTAPVEFEFDERVNVFVGPNASGKSTLLMILAEHFLGTDVDAKRVISHPDSRSRFWLSELADEEFAQCPETIVNSHCAPTPYPPVKIGSAPSATLADRIRRLQLLTFGRYAKVCRAYRPFKTKPTTMQTCYCPNLSVAPALCRLFAL